MTGTPANTGTASALAGVVVVTFFPEGDYCGRLRRMATQGGAMVVVDNASAPHARMVLERLCGEQGWRFLGNERNRGIATALNQGMAELRKRGFEWALCFDQDSDPAPGFAEALVGSWRNHRKRDTVAVVGASYLEQPTGRKYRVLCGHRWCPLAFEKAPVGESDLDSVNMVITSGSLNRISTWAELGGFDDGLFIDLVDTEYCLRAQSAGWVVAVSARARLEHRFGDRTTKTVFGIRFGPTNHSALRRYYMARNLPRVICRHGCKYPHWVVFELCALGLNFTRVLLGEDRRWRKILGMLWGTYHGLLGRSGPAPKNVVKRLAR